MPKFRIKRTYDKYCVQVRSWQSCFLWYTINQRLTYDDAKVVLGMHISHAQRSHEVKMERKAFKTKYYYPPLADKESDNA